MWLWLLGLLLLAAMWSAWLYHAWHVGGSIAASVLLVLAVAGWRAFRRVRARLAAGALERALLRQADRHAAQQTSGQRAALQEARKLFVESLEALKRSRLGANRSRSALAVLPWYIVMGPAGAGKTSAIRASGLTFPSMGNAGGGIPGIGSAGNCDWWLSDQAILLDMASGDAPGDQDRSEWLAFVDLLRTHRARQPLNGVLVVLSTPELAASAPEQLEQLARSLRSRIDEVTSRVAVQVPVYVLFNKVDQVTGFVECFGDFTKAARGQVWGMTFPFARGVAHEGFPEGYDALLGRLLAALLRRLPSLANPVQRAKAVQLPAGLWGLARNFSTLLEVMFSRERSQGAPLLRGVYLTSAAQQEQPGSIPQLLDGLGVTLSEDGAPGQSRSYFFSELWSKVVIADQHLASRPGAARRALLLQRLSVGLAGLLTAALMVGPALTSWRNNRTLSRSTRELAEPLASAEGLDGSRVLEQMQLAEPLRERLQLLEHWRETSPPASLRWGMYSGETLRRAVSDRYGTLLRASFAAPVHEQLAQELLAIAPSGTEMGVEEFNASYDALKLYLMLGEPARLDVEWATPRLTQLWSASLGAEEDEGLARHVRQYLTMLHKGQQEPLPSEPRVLEHARTELLQASIAARLYDDLVREANAAVAPIRRETIFFGSVEPFVSSLEGKDVPGAYTLQGWERVRKLLDAERSALLAESWVLGEDAHLPAAAVSKQMDELRQLYFTRYVEAWRGFIEDLDVVRPQGSDQALEQLHALVEPEWPYLRLLRTVGEHAALPMTDAEAGKAPGQLVRPADEAPRGGEGEDAAAPAVRNVSPVERAMASLVQFGQAPAGHPDAPLQQYIRTLRKLVGVLNDARHAVPAPEPKALADDFQAAFRDTSALLAELDPLARGLLTPLLMSSITHAWECMVQDAGGAAAGLWELAVWKVWQKELDGKYPFDPGAQTDATMQDVTAFFHPRTGVLWSFYERHLKWSIERQGEVFTPTQRFSAESPFSDAFLGFLQRSAQVTGAAFAPDAGEVAVPFEVNLHSVSAEVAEVTLEIDGVARRYRNTPEEWLAMRWPAKKAKTRGARVLVRGYSGLEEEIARGGDFGFLRLLDAAVLKPASSTTGKGALQASWPLRTQPGAFVRMEIRPGRSQHPFNASRGGLWSELDCPRVIRVSR